MPSEAPTWEESTATPTWENSTETPTWEDSSDTPQKQGYAAAVGNSLAQEAVKGVGHALAGYGSLTEIMPVSAGVGAAPSAYDIQENIRRSRRPAAQVMTAIQQNPAVRMGQAIAAAAPKPLGARVTEAFSSGDPGQIINSYGDIADTAQRLLGSGLAAGQMSQKIDFEPDKPPVPDSLSVRPQFSPGAIDRVMTPEQSPEDYLSGKSWDRESTRNWNFDGEVIKPQGTIARLIEETAQAPIRFGLAEQQSGGKFKVQSGPIPVLTGDAWDPREHTALAYPAGKVLEWLPPGAFADASAAVYNAAAGFANFFLSPQGVALGATMAPEALAGTGAPAEFKSAWKLASQGGDVRPLLGELKTPFGKVFSGYFAYDMARHAPEALQSGDEALKRGDRFGALRGWISGAMNVGLAGLAAKHATEFKGKLPADGNVKPPPLPETISPEAREQGTAGLGAFNLVLPPYFRGGRNRPADAIEGELLGKVPPRSAAQVERLPAAVTDAGLNEVVPTDLTTDIRRAPMPLAGDPPLRSESSVERLPAAVTDAGLNEVVPTDLTTDIRRAPMPLAGDPPLRSESSSTPEAVTKPTENAPGAAVPSTVAPVQSSVEPKPAKGTKAETPAAAVAKVQEHVAEVASGEKAVAKSEVRSQKSEVGTTTGPRPAKEIKSELVQRLEKELAKVPEPKFTQSKVVTTKGKKEFKIGIPERTDEIFQVREGRDGVWEVVKRGSSSTSVKGKTTTIPDKVLNTTGRYATPTEALRVAKATLEEYLYPDRAKTVTIEIPGDGTFTIKRTHYALSHTLERAQKLSTASAGRGAVRDERPGFNRDLWYQQARGGKARVDRLAKAQAAVEGRLREIKREGRLRFFGDPELAMLRTAQGAIYILKGVKNFAEWSAQMVKRFGNEIKPHLEDLWEQAKQVAAGTHPTIGLSQHGVKTIANEELSASVREALNVHYAKLTDEAARTIAGARIAEAGGPLPAAAKLNAGAFDGEPGKVQNAIAAATMRQLSLQERLARERGAEQQADALADAQVAVAQRSIDRSPDAGQTLQSFKLFYEQFSPAAWLRKFKKDIGQVAVTRTEAAIGKPVEPSPAGVAQGIADKVGEETAKRNPKLGRIIQEEFGTAGTAEGTARPVGETLADRLERTGRAAKGKGKAVADKISKFYQEEVGKFRRLHGIPAFDPATQRDILRRAKAINALPEDSVQRREAAQELMNHIRRLKGFQWWELPLDFWYANILSGPVTHLKNISGNAASLGAEVGMQIMRQPSALPSIIEALGRALPRGATEAANILRTGHDTASRHAGKFETHGALDAVTGTAGKLLLPWKLVGRALKAADVMFFYPLQETKGAVLASRASGLPIFNGERAAEVRRIMGWSEQARAKAAAQAKAEGLTGNTARRREYELLEQARPETLMESARDFAFHGTFNNDPYGVLGAVQRGFERTAREVPALKLIAPFTRIITNITNSGMNWTPVGYWRAARAQGLKLLIGRETNTGKLYGRTISDPTAVGDAFARATVGSLALGGLAMAAGQYVFDRNPQFMVTGSGPADPDQRKLLRQTGWIPYSIKIGDRYYTYQDKMWAMPLGVVGHYLDAIRYRKLDQQDALNRAAFALSSSFNVIVQSSWLQGLSAIFDQAGRDSVKNPLKALPSQALRTASSFVVPNALRQVDQMFDPTRYTADDIQAMMLAQLPLARRENRPDLNVFGEPVAAPLSKTFLSKVEGDGLTRMLAARRLWPGVPADPYLTPAQTYALVKYRGPQLRAELLANYADLATLPHAEANALLARLSRDATVQAKKDLGLDTLSGIEKQVSKFNER